MEELKESDGEEETPTRMMRFISCAVGPRPTINDEPEPISNFDLQLAAAKNKETQVPKPTGTITMRTTNQALKTAFNE